MSQWHAVYSNGKMRHANTFINGNTITEINYDGKLLYNVLMSEYSLINVNGLLCETLHPDNPLAKPELYQ